MEHLIWAISNVRYFYSSPLGEKTILRRRCATEHVQLAQTTYYVVIRKKIVGTEHLANWGQKVKRENRNVRQKCNLSRMESTYQLDDFDRIDFVIKPT